MIFTKDKRKAKKKSLFQVEKNKVERFLSVRKKAKFADTNKPKTIFFGIFLRPGSYVKKFFQKTLKSIVYKIHNAFSEWKLKRLRTKALKAESIENTENRSLQKAVPEKSKVFQNPNYTQASSKSKYLKNLGLNHLELIWNNLNFGIWISKTKHFFKTLKSRTILKKSLALATILAVIIMAYFQNAPTASAATFTLYQTVWTGVSASEVHNPTGGQTTITTYSAKDASLQLADSDKFKDIVNCGDANNADQ